MWFRASSHFGRDIWNEITGEILEIFNRGPENEIKLNLTFFFLPKF